MGSRLAGAIGQAPLLDVALCGVTAFWPFEFPAGGQQLCFSSCFNNIKAVSVYASKAVQILDIVAAHLQQNWSLSIKGTQSVSGRGSV